MSECTRANRPWMFGQVNSKHWIMIRPDCKQWTCPECAERNARGWVFRIRCACELWHKQGLPITFITITSHRKLKTKDATLAVLPNAWNKLQARIRRKSDCDFNYVGVPEQHQNGRVHMHLLATATITKSWLKDACASSGLGYQADCETPEDQARSAGYVAKYLFKAASEEWPTGFRRVRTSQNFPEIPIMERDDATAIEYWLCAPTEERFKQIIRDIQRDGGRLVNRDTGEIMV